MLFNSLTFIVFLAVVLFLHRLPFAWQVKKWNLWMASYIFYAAWNPPFVVLLWISTVVDWFAGNWIYRTPKRSFKRALLFLSLGANLGLLGYFKYGEFLLENFIGFLSVFHIDFQPAAPDVVLPVGISFYTFQSISYSFDIYRGKIRPWKRFSDFALFVTFFPQLVAGPIVRAADFLPQTVEPRQASARQLGWGLSLIAIGLFEKIILADGILAPVADNVFAQPLAAGQMDAWIGTLAFSGQIFFDFSGYSICAIGTAMCLGFVLPDNFHFPYAAVGFADFWRRWHRSLSTWLRDYLYISLGGNRKGSARTHLNLMLTMLIGGLWHGASWRFMVWGGLHGLYLIMERWARRIFRTTKFFEKSAIRLILAVWTYYLICITWIFFRAEDFPSAFTLMYKIFSGATGNLVRPTEALMVIAVNLGFFAGHWILRDSSLEAVAEKISWKLRAVILAAILLTLILSPGEDRAFIYFQF